MLSILLFFLHFQIFIKLPISTTPLTNVSPLQHRSKYAPFSTKGPLIDKDEIQWADLKRWSQVWQLNVLVFPYTCDYLSEANLIMFSCETLSSESSPISFVYFHSSRGFNEFISWHIAVQ